MFHMLDADSPASRLQTEPPPNCKKQNGVGDERVGRDPRQRLFEVFGLVTGGLWCPFGRSSVYASICVVDLSSVNVSMPRWLWWMRMISRVPSKRRLMTCDRWCNPNRRGDMGVSHTVGGDQQNLVFRREVPLSRTGLQATWADNRT